MIIIAIILCLIGFNLYAAPADVVIGSSAVHGSPITITGTGFGTKSPAAPLKCRGMESGRANYPDLCSYRCLYPI
jgi:hypothetical protein